MPEIQLPTQENDGIAARSAEAIAFMTRHIGLAVEAGAGAGVFNFIKSKVSENEEK